MVKLCVKCGTAFVTLSSKAKFCSKECSMKYYNDQRKHTYYCLCKQCGAAFSTNNKTQVYCSKACRDKHFRLFSVDHVSVCVFCKKPFTTSKTNKKYCSKVCYVAAKAERDKVRFQKEHKDDSVS